MSLAAVGRSAVMLTGAAAIAQVIGFARQLYFAAQVGVSGELDALLIALATTIALVAILTTGVRTAMVPAYAGVKKEHGPAGARRNVPGSRQPHGGGFGPARSNRDPPRP